MISFCIPRVQSQDKSSDRPVKPVARDEMKCLPSRISWERFVELIYNIWRYPAVLQFVQMALILMEHKLELKENSV